VLRDYIAKKEQIVEFIEKKKDPEHFEKYDEEIHVGDQVVVRYHSSFPIVAEVLRIERARSGNIILVRRQYGSNERVLQSDVIKLVGTTTQAEGGTSLELIARNAMSGLERGKKYKCKDKQMLGSKEVTVLEFGWTDNSHQVNVKYLYRDHEGEKRFPCLSIPEFKLLYEDV